jgi:hypothetical protein
MYQWNFLMAKSTKKMSLPFAKKDQNKPKGIVGTSASSDYSFTFPMTALIAGGVHIAKDVLLDKASIPMAIGSGLRTFAISSAVEEYIYPLVDQALPVSKMIARPIMVGGLSAGVDVLTGVKMMPMSAVHEAGYQLAGEVVTAGMEGGIKALW